MGPDASSWLTKQRSAAIDWVLGRVRESNEARRVLSTNGYCPYGDLGALIERAFQECRQRVLDDDYSKIRAAINAASDALPPEMVGTVAERIAELRGELDVWRNGFICPECGRCDVPGLLADRDELIARRNELLVLVRKLSAEVPYEEERGQVATLIAEVGTLRARLDELERKK